MPYEWLPANGLDYVILLVLAVGFLRGYNRGLVQAIVSLLGVIAAWLLAGLLAQPVAQRLARHYGAQEALVSWWQQQFVEVIQEPFAHTVNVPLLWESFLPTDQLSDWATSLLAIVTFIVLLILFLAIARLITFTIGRWTDRGRLTAAGNHWLGGVFGLVRNTFLLTLFLSLAALLPALGGRQWFAQMMHASHYGPKLTGLFHAVTSNLLS